MLKKICLLLIFWTIFPTLLLAHAEGEKSKDDAITVLDGIAPKVDEAGNVILAGKVTRLDITTAYGVKSGLVSWSDDID